MSRSEAFKRPLIIAHRGASHDAPENTLAAFRLAWDQGADGIEGDFRLTRDAQFVCLHDDNTARTTGQDIVCAEAEFEELQRLDAGAWKGPSWHSERIPTLGQVLATAPPGKRVFIELKGGLEIVPPLMDALQSVRRPLAELAAMSFDEQVVAAIKQQQPKLPVYWLVSFEDLQSSGEPAPSARTLMETARRLRADGLGCQDHAAIDTGFTAVLRMAMLPLHIWTINDARAARRYASLGAASLTTDRPAWLKQQLQVR